MFVPMSVILMLCMAYMNKAPNARLPKPVKNIVLVHGAFADASGWETVHKILTKKGYRVTAIQNPLTSLEDRAEALL